VAKKKQLFNSDPRLSEFYQFLLENYSGNPNTCRTIVYAVHRLLESNMTPDDLPVSTHSKSIYRRAWRLWNDFLTYKEVSPTPVLAQVRRKGAIRESKLKRSLKRVLKNEVEYRMAMLKAVSTGKLYISRVDDDPMIIYVD